MPIALKNYYIKLDILKNRGLNTRVLINKLAAKYNTPKQRICGNISYLKKMGIITVYPNKPHSIIY